MIFKVLAVQHLCYNLVHSTTMIMTLTIILEWLGYLNMSCFGLKS